MVPRELLSMSTVAGSPQNGGDLSRHSLDKFELMELEIIEKLGHLEPTFLSCMSRSSH